MLLCGGLGHRGPTSLLASRTTQSSLAEAGRCQVYCLGVPASTTSPYDANPSGCQKGMQQCAQQGHLLCAEGVARPLSTPVGQTVQADLQEVFHASVQMRPSLLFAESGGPRTLARLAGTHCE